MKATLTTGVPKTVQAHGGWWRIGAAGSATRCVGKRGAARPAGLRVILLVALLVVADALFWGLVPGLSLAVFVALTFLAAGLLWPRAIPRRRLALASCLLLLSLLPLIELVQPLSLLLACVGAPPAFALLAGRPARGSLWYWWRAPVFAARAAAGAVLGGCTRLGSGAGLPGIAALWALPLVVGGVFGALLLRANPVLDRALLDAMSLDLTVPSPRRAVFWAFVAGFVWPMLRLSLFARILSPTPPHPRLGPVRMPRALNSGAIVRSLVLFNVMFAVQNALDLTFLAAGVRLPEGMSFAEYAHRGAYPLVLLAGLSGAFALLARPFVPAAPQIRWLLLVWIVQTVWLTVSSGVRLDLYVSVYGLTHLRLAAAIWMGFVGAGLLLLLWYVWVGQTQAWVLRRLAAMGALALYGCAFVSFDRVIAQYNLTHPVQQDPAYLCSLGEAVVPVFLEARGHSVKTFCRDAYYVGPVVHTPRDWREWGFRNARVRRSLAQIKKQAGTQ